MISFKVIEENNAYEIFDSICSGMGEDEISLGREILDSLVYDGDAEFAVSVSSGCLLIRICDMGRYGFLFPFELTEDVDVRRAVLDISEYAMREEIECAVYGVPSEELGAFSDFRHTETLEETDSDTYTVVIKNECMLIEEIPELIGERVKLNEILPSDVSDYAKLSKDENVNKYWGYRYTEDCESPSDEWFYENMRSEFSRGVSVSFAVRLGDRFIGEVILYAFDGRGNAEIAVRLLPKFCGKGYARESLSLALTFARNIDLNEIRAVVNNENIPSIRLFSRLADRSEEEDCKIIYKIYLE